MKLTLILWAIFCLGLLGVANMPLCFFYDIAPLSVFVPSIIISLGIIVVWYCGHRSVVKED